MSGSEIDSVKNILYVHCAKQFNDARMGRVTFIEHHVTQVAPMGLLSCNSTTDRTRV